MRKRMYGLRVLLPAVSLLAATASAFGTTPLGTAFTYQGQLKSGGVPLTATVDFQFSLWDSATSGLQIGSTLVYDGAGSNPPSVSLTGGLFTVQLDFGASVYSG